MNNTDNRGDSSTVDEAVNPTAPHTEIITQETERPSSSRSQIRYRVVGGSKDFAVAFSRRGIGTCASSVAFFFFMSLIPLVILLSMLLPFLGFPYSMMAEAATSVTPDMVDPLVQQILREAYSAGGRLLPPVVLLMLWSSSAGMLALIRGLNTVYEAEERRSYPMLVLLSVLYTLSLLLLFISTMVLTVLGDSLRGFLFGIITETDSTAAIYESFRYHIAFLLSVVIFSVMYTFIPAGRRRFLLQLPGAFFTSATFLVFSWFFSLYLSHGNKYTLFYGSLAATAVFLFWLYCCFYIFLIGAYLNQYFKVQVHRAARTVKHRLKRMRGR